MQHNSTQFEDFLEYLDDQRSKLHAANMLPYQSS